MITFICYHRAKETPLEDRGKKDLRCLGPGNCWNSWGLFGVIEMFYILIVVVMEMYTFGRSH